MTDGLHRRRVLRLAASALAGAPAAVLAGGCAASALQPARTLLPAGQHGAVEPVLAGPGAYPGPDGLGGVVLAPAAPMPSPPGGSPADRALAALVTGNGRFVRGAPLHPHSIAEAQVHARLQRPLAAVVGCCDSRVSPEALLDQGFGDLFVVRTVAQVLDTAALASVEYAVTELAVPLVLVLGHERCGAIRAAIDAFEAHEKGLPLPLEPVPPNLRTVLDGLEPVVLAALRSGASDPYEKAMRLNVERVAGQLTAALAGTGTRIATARYDLDDGRLLVLS